MRIAAGALPGSELARALHEVAQRVDGELRSYADACSRWSFDLEASVAAYEAVDRSSAAQLNRTSWSAV